MRQVLGTKRQEGVLLASLCGAGVGLACYFWKVGSKKRPNDYGEQRRLLTLGSRAVSNLPSTVEHSEKFLANARGMAIYTQEYTPKGSSNIKAVIFICHGYGDSSSWFFRDIALRLVESNFAVVALDYEGHGKSDGLHAYISSFDNVVDDVTMVFDVAKKKFEGKRFFLLGESMGGAVAVLTYKRQGPQNWDGCILMAPMVKVSEKTKPPEIIVKTLSALGQVFPEAPIVPSAPIIKNAFKLKEKASDFASCPYYYGKQPRLHTALQILKVTDELSSSLEEFTAPFLVLHGDDDRVTDPDLSRQLYDTSKSKDKSLVIYPGYWHSLIGGESAENGEEVYNAIIDWVEQRSIKS